MKRIFRVSRAPHPGADAPALAPLLETPEPLSPNDEVTVAAAWLERTGLPAVPIAREGQLLGIVDERTVLAALVGQASGGPAPRATAAQMLRPAVSLPATAPLDDAISLLQRPEVELLPITGSGGEYVGILRRRPLLAALEARRRPAVVGGMATPFGVYLTSIHHRGGAGDLGLMATGVYLFALSMLALGAVGLAAALLSPRPLETALSYLSPTLIGAGAVPPPGPWAEVAHLFVFLLLLRLSPLAGYHSGEHQTVHALERGLPLTPADVGRMPRPHPRCGTNLAVLLGGLFVLAQAAHDGALSVGSVVALSIALLLLWRRAGLWAQAVFTTRPPSPRQLGAGIAAGKMLVSRYQRNPGHHAGWFRRVWNRGLVQVGVGFLIAWAGGSYAARLLGQWMA